MSSRLFKKLIVVVLAAVMCLNFSGCGKKFDLAAYKTLVSDCQKKMESNTIELVNMVNYEINYMQAAGRLGSGLTASQITEQANKWIEEKAGVTPEKLNSEYNDISEKYKKITATGVSGQEAKQINDAFLKVYDSYNDLHYLATQPNTSASDFANKALEDENNFTKDEETLKLLLK